MEIEKKRSLQKLGQRILRGLRPHPVIQKIFPAKICFTHLAGIGEQMIGCAVPIYTTEPSKRIKNFIIRCATRQDFIPPHVLPRTIEGELILCYLMGQYYMTCVGRDTLERDTLRWREEIAWAFELEEENVLVTVASVKQAQKLIYGPSGADF